MSHSFTTSTALRYASILTLSLGCFALSSQTYAMPSSQGITKAHATIALNHVSDSKTQDAQNFIERMTAQAIGFLSNPDLSEDERTRQFQALLEKNFDMGTIGRFALGRHWRSMNTAQKEEYQRLFEEMVVSVYSRRFSEYKGQKIKVVDAVPSGKSDIVVNSLLISDGEPDISISWRVRPSKGQFKIIDIVVEGVSMAMTQRSDFSSVIQRGGGKIDVLLEHLKK